MNTIILDTRWLQEFAAIPYWTKLIRAASIVALYDHKSNKYTMLKDRTGTCDQEEQVSYSKLLMSLSNLAWSNSYEKARNYHA